MDALLDIVVGSDNQAFIRDAQSPMLSDLRKHIDVKYQLLVDQVWKWNVKLEYVQKGKMMTDMLTKNASAQKVKLLMEVPLWNS